MTSIFFSATNVTCTRNNRLLFSSVNFLLNEGEVIHIRGENGIGKSTLLRSLAGLSAPYSGDIKWCGVNIADNEEYKQQRYFLGHKNSIKSSLTVEENIVFTLPAKRISGNQISTSLECMGLESKRDLLANSLSSGQKQRLALSKLLLSGSRIWILDEPFTCLDIHGCNLVQSMMQTHLENRGIIIFTSHYPVSIKMQGFISLELKPLFEIDDGEGVR